MKLLSIFAATLLMLVGSAYGQSQLLVGWNFNDSNLTADHGTGTMTLSGLPVPVYLPVGSSQNLYSGDSAGNSLSLVSTTLNNGGTLTLRFATTGYNAPKLTYAIGSLVNGFTTVQWAYSLNGSNYTNFGSGKSIPSITSTSDLSLMQTHAVDLTSLVGTLANQSDVYLRGTFTGLTALSTSTLVVDNFQVLADAQSVPEPAASVMLAGLGGLGWALLARRRRSLRAA